MQAVLLCGSQGREKVLQQFPGSCQGHDHVRRHCRSHGHAGIQPLPGVLLALLDAAGSLR